MDHYRRIIDEAAEHECPSLNLNNNNEPLLDKNIIPHLAYAHRKGIIDNVYPCCFQSMNSPAGNMKTDSLYDIWHGDLFKEYRRIVKEEDWEANRFCSEFSKLR